MKMYALVWIGVMTLQLTDTRMSRFGLVGRNLPEREIAQITDLAHAGGKAPWLMLGFLSMIPGEVRLDVYLEPDEKTDRVHRGRILRLLADDPPRVSARSPWRIETTASYAYVVRPGGGPPEIADEHDSRWPFAVTGGIDDETIVSLLRFVRSRPALPGVPEGHGPREQLVTAPLSGVVAQQGDEFLVELRTGDAAVLRVTVLRKNGKWHVIKWDAAIV